MYVGREGFCSVYPFFFLLFGSLEALQVRNAWEIRRSGKKNTFSVDTAAVFFHLWCCFWMLFIPCFMAAEVNLRYLILQSNPCTISFEFRDGKCQSSNLECDPPLQDNCSVGNTTFLSNAIFSSSSGHTSGKRRLGAILTRTMQIFLPLSNTNFVSRSNQP